MFSHRFHTQKLWCFQGGALVSSAPTQQNLHSPTEFRTHSCLDILPQISQIYTEIFAERFSHRIHRTHRTFLLRYSPTDFTDLHRNFLLGYSPTDFTHRSYGAFKGVHLSPLGFAACQSKKCTNTTKSTFSYRIQNTFLLGYSPTDFTDLHRTFLLGKIL